MKNFFIPLFALLITCSVNAQADYYVNLTAPSQQLNATVWKDTQGQVAYTVKTDRRDLLGERKDAIFYKNSKEKFTLERKRMNWVLRDQETGDFMVYRPFKYVLPNGEVLNRKVRNLGRSIKLENEQGEVVATADILRSKEARRRLEINIEQATANDELLSAMLSLEIMDQYREIFLDWSPLLLLCW